MQHTWGEGCGASGGGKLICLKRNSLSFGVFYFFKYARKRQRRSRCRSRGFDKTTTTTTTKTRTPYSPFLSSLPSLLHLLPLHRQLNATRQPKKKILLMKVGTLLFSGRLVPLLLLEFFRGIFISVFFFWVFLFCDLWQATWKMTRKMPRLAVSVRLLFFCFCTQLLATPFWPFFFFFSG